MKARLALGLLLLAVVGCRSDSRLAPDAPSRPHASAACDAGRAQGFVGREVSDAVAGDAQKAAGAAVVRTLHPADIVTMEYRSDRLTLRVNANNRILSVRCG